MSIDPSPHYFGEESQSLLKLKNQGILNQSRQSDRASAKYFGESSGDSIATRRDKDYKDCVIRSKSPEVRHLRYIQSAKGTWSYNL